MKQSKQTSYGLTGLTASVMLMSTVASSAQAQVQTAGKPGSPSATSTISGKQLPPPDPEFGGEIKEKASDSKAWWPPHRPVFAGAGLLAGE